MKNSKIKKCFALWVLLTVPFSASGVPVTIGFSGEIDSFRVITTDPFSGRIGIGTPFKGEYTYDTSTANTGTDTYGIYIHNGQPYGFSVEISGYAGRTIEEPNGWSLHYRKINDADSHKQDIQTSGLMLGGISTYLVQIFLNDLSASAHQNVSLSPVAPDLSLYGDEVFFLGVGPGSGGGAGAEVVMSGKLLEVYNVDEPATLLLLPTALAGLAYKRYRGNKGK